jgi:pimeloyl-ACP methyl ester carboxylesterase
VSGPLFFGAPSDALFGWFHPADGARGCGVVVCNPLTDDCVRAHRPMRHLAERLARAGFPVLRFDFHGTGDSSGDERGADRVATWLEDVGRAIAELRAQSGVDRVALVGLRLGATLAMTAAARAGGVDSVVAWGAFESGAAFVAESTRMHKMHRMLEPQSFAMGPKEHPDGEEALGFFLTNETIAALGRIDLRALDARPAARALVIDVANTPVALGVVEKLKSLDADVTHRHMPGQRFLISAPHKAALPTEILDAIVAWLEAKHPPVTATRAIERAPAATTVKRDTAAIALEERPFFANERRLFGVLTKPPHDDRRAGRPAVLLLNAGTSHRIGPHRASVRMARTWAERGFYVLRLDLSGIGDSAAAPGEAENLAYPKDAIDECAHAMSALGRETGASRFVVAGLCSGADIAFQTALHDDRVTGLVMMNPQTFCVHDLSNIQAYKDGRYYQDSFFRKESWKKLARGHVDVARVARMIAPKVKLEAMTRMKRLFHVSAAEAEERPDVPGWIRAMADRGVETLLVATVHDPGIDFAEAFYGKRMHELANVERFRRVDLEGTDNTFTSIHAREVAQRTITDHLVGRHHS